LMYAYLQLGDGQRALDSLWVYTRMRGDIPEPGLLEAKQKAVALIAAQSRPSTAASSSGS